jgi:hypothetical protein
MSYLKIEVRGGGLVIRNESWELKMATTPNAEFGNVLELVRSSSIKGLWSYLLGNTEKLFSYDENMNVKKMLISDPYIDELASKSILKIRKKPHSTVFFARKDLHSKTSAYSDNPTVNLRLYSFEESDPSVKLFRPALELLCSSNNLFIINKYFIDNGKRLEFKPGETILPNIDNIPDSKMGDKIRGYINEDVESKKIYSKAVFDLIEITNQLCAKDIEFKNKFSDSGVSKFSVFTSPTQNKHWVNKKFSSIVRGEPLTLICLDFDIFVPYPSENIITKLTQGPFIGRWGEGGVASLIIKKNELPPSEALGQSDTPFVTYAEMRKMGISLKFQVWEKKGC